MNYLKILLALCLTSYILRAEARSKFEREKEAVVAEGKWLFRSESTSWYGTDIFIANYTNTSNIGGYFSYIDSNKSKCIFYSKEEHPRVIGTITFNETIDADHGFLDLMEREFTSLEKDYYTIRAQVKKMVYTDSFFQHYKNTDFNIIPKIDGGEKKAYIIMGSQQNDVVYFGNDYLITFNKKNKPVKKEKIHEGIIPVNYGQKMENGAPIVGSIHTHLPEYSDIITPTDICTTMLYEKLAGWTSIVVVSEKYISIWSCAGDALIITPKTKSEDKK